MQYPSTKAPVGRCFCFFPPPRSFITRNDKEDCGQYAPNDLIWTASGRIIVRIQVIGVIHFRWPDAHSLQSVTGSFIQNETFSNNFLCDSIASHVIDCRESPWWYLGHLDLEENAKVFAIYFHSINHVTAKRPIR